jgi:hypothetical protein
MKLDPEKLYHMPLVMGPALEAKKLKLNHPRVEVLAFQYLTDPEALQIVAR